MFVAHSISMYARYDPFYRPQPCLPQIPGSLDLAGTSCALGATCREGRRLSI